jgi:cellulose synthase (UDP-forming)
VRAITVPHTRGIFWTTRATPLPRAGDLDGRRPPEIVGVPGAKAGKINVALEGTSEDLISCSIRPHPVPEPPDRVIGFFRDPEVGFVQVAQAYHNPASPSSRAPRRADLRVLRPDHAGDARDRNGGRDRRTARSAARRSPRSAAGIGLPKTCHVDPPSCAGWKSVYVPEILCATRPGGSRLVHEAAAHGRAASTKSFFTDYPRLFRRLSTHQKISYFDRKLLLRRRDQFHLLRDSAPLPLASGGEPAAILISRIRRDALPLGLFGILIYR